MLQQATLKVYNQFTSGFIITKATPQIYFMPTKRDEKINGLIEESKKQQEDKLSAALQQIEPRTFRADVALEDKAEETSQQEKENSSHNEDGEVLAK